MNYLFRCVVVGDLLILGPVVPVVTTDLTYTHRATSHVVLLLNGLFFTFGGRLLPHVHWVVPLT